MKEAEMKVVKHKLAMYQDLLALAAEKDMEALGFQLYFESEAGAHAIRMDPKVGCGSGSGTTRETRLNRILSDLQEVEDLAKKYRSKAAKLKDFIDSINDKRKCFLEDAFIRGKKYSEIAASWNCTTAYVSQSIARCLLTVPASDAVEFGLLESVNC